MQRQVAVVVRQQGEHDAVALEDEPAELPHRDDRERGEGQRARASVGRAGRRGGRRRVAATAASTASHRDADAARPQDAQGHGERAPAVHAERTPPPTAATAHRSSRPRRRRARPSGAVQSGQPLAAIMHARPQAVHSSGRFSTATAHATAGVSDSRPPRETRLFRQDRPQDLHSGRSAVPQRASGRRELRRPRACPGRPGGGRARRATTARATDLGGQRADDAAPPARAARRPSTARTACRRPTACAPDGSRARARRAPSARPSSPPAFVSATFVATTPIDVFCPASGRPGVSPARSASIAAPRPAVARARAGQHAPRRRVDDVAERVHRHERRDDGAVRAADGRAAEPALHRPPRSRTACRRWPRRRRRRCPRATGPLLARARRLVARGGVGPDLPVADAEVEQDRRRARSAPSRRRPGSRRPSPRGSARRRSPRRGRTPSRRRARSRAPPAPSSRDRARRSRACPARRRGRRRRTRRRSSTSTTVQPVGRRAVGEVPDANAGDVGEPAGGRRTR